MSVDVLGDFLNCLEILVRGTEIHVGGRFEGVMGEFVYDPEDEGTAYIRDTKGVVYRLRDVELKPRGTTK